MRIKEPKGDRAYYIVNYCVLIVFTLMVLYPLVYVLSASFSSAGAIANNEVVLWPVGVTADAYKTILESPNLVIGFANSVLYTVAGALIGTALTLLAGYATSRDDLPFRRLLTFFFLIPALFAGGIVPTYIVVQQLGLLDTRWAIILPGAMSVFNVIITRTFYQMNVPNEVLEAAKVDGANDFRFFFRIALPLSKPIIAVNLLFYGITQWNGWFNAFLYTTDPGLQPLQLVLRELLSQSAINPSMIGSGDVAELLRRKELFDKLKYAMIVVAMIPPLIAYPFVQKHFVKGALIGSVK
ncbi:carbohydrate ABC transporter permease [Microlunatus soli]|uniref:Carbohydrate ABC transporter membrane protein 2, CUT1 family n=1 Tax=Microlunatus soli TaxID=630515 RepID=A0A1H1TDA7_9ACTN|nr:carbohydrate ABC transporter permease [Microlunatus soli]SDS58114.1 carbohydrate ABC transporter membrane protein 2, CUT1 family [Microlunatus soli]